MYKKIDEKDIAYLSSLFDEKSIFIGNDVSDDMPAALTGMKVFLKTRCLINKNDEDISKYPNGDWAELLDYIKTI